MLEFYGKFFSPSSPSRARISVHLHARGAGELDTKVINMLQSLELSDVPPEKRQSLDELDGYLREGRGISDDKRNSIISKVKELGLAQATHNAGSTAAINGVSAIGSAVEISDVRQYKAGLLASVGARPVKDITEYEEMDSKL